MAGSSVSPATATSAGAPSRAPARPAATAKAQSAPFGLVGPYHFTTAAAAHSAVRFRWQPVHALGVPILIERSGRGARSEWSGLGCTIM
jgi:hypothetical protein